MFYGKLNFSLAVSRDLTFTFDDEKVFSLERVVEKEEIEKKSEINLENNAHSCASEKEFLSSMELFSCEDP
jgi:hypothetical protein